VSPSAWVYLRTRALRQGSVDARSECRVCLKCNIRVRASTPVSTGYDFNAVKAVVAHLKSPVGKVPSANPKYAPLLLGTGSTECELIIKGARCRSSLNWIKECRLGVQTPRTWSGCEQSPMRREFSRLVPVQPAKATYAKNCSTREEI
jgi:hypothetical protein